MSYLLYYDNSSSPNLIGYNCNLNWHYLCANMFLIFIKNVNLFVDYFYQLLMLCAFTLYKSKNIF